MTYKLVVDPVAIVGKVTEVASKVIRKITYELHAAIVLRITQGPKTGRKYKRRRKNGEVYYHQASAPGESPASDSGHLRLTVQVGKFENPLVGEVFVNAVYAAALEYGFPKRNLEPRPYIKPSIEGVISRLQRGGVIS